MSLKIKNVASLIEETWAITPINSLKKRTWPIHQFLRPILWRFLLPQWHVLFLLKTDAEAAVPLQTHHMYSTLKRLGNNRFHVVSTWNTCGVFIGLKMFFKIDALKNFAIFTGKQYCRNFKSSFFIEHLRWLLLQMFCFTLYFQKDVAEYIQSYYKIFDIL